jgi:hypothetical protein
MAHRAANHVSGYYLHPNAARLLVSLRRC